MKIQNRGMQTVYMDTVTSMLCIFVTRRLLRVKTSKIASKIPWVTPEKPSSLFITKFLTAIPTFLKNKARWEMYESL